MMISILKRLFRLGAPALDHAAEVAPPAPLASSKSRDFSLYSGERQTARAYEDIRLDHRNRYEWALQFLPESGCGMDVFCGNGYGTHRLSSGRKVLGIDASVEAIEFAKTHYNAPGVEFRANVYPFFIPERSFDFIVSLESIEHIECDADFFADLARSLRPGGVFIFSVPCEAHLPHRLANPDFHFRHYELEEIEGLISENSLEVISWAGQNTYVIENGVISGLVDEQDCHLATKTSAQFLIFATRKPLDG